MGARCHHVLDRNFFQVEQVEQDAAVLFLHYIATFHHHGAQLVGRQALVACTGADMQQAQQDGDQQMHQPDHWSRQHQQRAQHHAGSHGDALRVARADDLGQDLRKHDQQQRHQHDCNDQHGFLAAEHGHGDQRDQRCGQRIGQRAADEHHGEHPVGAFEQPQRSGGPLAAPACKMAQPVPAGGHQRRFAHRKKCGEKDQYNEREQLRPKGNGVHSAAFCRICQTYQQFVDLPAVAMFGFGKLDPAFLSHRDVGRAVAMKPDSILFKIGSAAPPLELQCDAPLGCFLKAANAWYWHNRKEQSGNHI